MHILIVDDDETLSDLLSRELVRAGHRVALAATGTDGQRQAIDDEPDVVLLDLMLPDLPGVEVLKRIRAERPLVEVIVLTAHGTVDTALAAMKAGAFDYLQKPCHLQELEQTLRQAEERRAAVESKRLESGLCRGAQQETLVGSSKAHEELQRFIGRVATTDSTILIRGETGTGKELVAWSIHRLSQRRAEPFVVVDCAGLQENLLQSELFGHEKGAFTGAARLKYGLFEVADGGTVFLDEIGDVSPAVQAGLLRVLETSTFRRVGGTQQVRVHVRLIAATNRDLERMMAEGQFRQDLFFRLNAIHVELPPLRQRPEDVATLIDHFVARHNANFKTTKRLSPEAVSACCAYPWPGNVRELRHVIDQALLLAESEVVTPGGLPPQLSRSARSGRGEPLPSGSSPALALAEVEKQHITHVLAEVGGHRARAARLLGISPRTLYRKICEYKLGEND